jgi:hypothetical protein
VKNVDTQFGFHQGKGATEVIFIITQVQEKYLVKEKGVADSALDMEKAFDKAPR